MNSFAAALPPNYFRGTFLASSAALLTRSNPPARNGVISEAKYPLQIFACDRIEANEHDRIWLVMPLHVKNPWLIGNQFIASFVSDCYTN